MSDDPDVDGPLPLGPPPPEASASTLRRITRDGHSLAVTLPPSWCRFLGLRRGDLVRVMLTARGTLELIPPGGAHEPGDVAAQLVERVQHLEQEGRRLRRKLYARPMRVVNQGFSLGVMWSLREWFYPLRELAAALTRGDVALVALPPAERTGEDPEPSGGRPPASAPEHPRAD